MRKLLLCAVLATGTAQASQPAKLIEHDTGNLRVYISPATVETPFGTGIPVHLAGYSATPYTQLRTTHGSVHAEFVPKNTRSGNAAGWIVVPPNTAVDSITAITVDGMELPWGGEQ